MRVPSSPPPWTLHISPLNRAFRTIHVKNKQTKNKQSNRGIGCISWITVTGRDCGLGTTQLWGTLSFLYTMLGENPGYTLSSTAEMNFSLSYLWKAPSSSHFKALPNFSIVLLAPLKIFTVTINPFTAVRALPFMILRILAQYCVSGTLPLSFTYEEADTERLRYSSEVTSLVRQTWDSHPHSLISQTMDTQTMSNNLENKKFNVNLRFSQLSSLALSSAGKVSSSRSLPKPFELNACSCSVKYSLLVLSTGGSIYPAPLWWLSLVIVIKTSCYETWQISVLLIFLLLW